MRQHLYEFHNQSPADLNAMEGDYDAAHDKAHAEGNFSPGWTGSPGDTHTHGDVFRDRRR
jgi:hypothetical protein